MILLYTYVADPKFDAVRRLTEEWLWHNVDTLTKKLDLSIWEWRIDPGDDLGYYWGLRAAWEEHRGVITLEQDIIPTLLHLEHLVNCPEQACACEYIMPTRSREMLVGRTVVLMRPPEGTGTSCRVKTDSGYRHARAGDNRCDAWGLGLSKFSADLTRKVDFPRQPQGWAALDTVLSELLAEKRVAAHRHLPPVEHAHPGHEPDLFDRVELGY